MGEGDILSLVLASEEPCSPCESCPCPAFLIAEEDMSLIGCLSEVVALIERAIVVIAIVNV